MVKKQKPPQNNIANAYIPVDPNATEKKKKRKRRAKNPGLQSVDRNGLHQLIDSVGEHNQETSREDSREF